MKKFAERSGGEWLEVFLSLNPKRDKLHPLRTREQGDNFHDSSDFFRRKDQGGKVELSYWGAGQQFWNFILKYAPAEVILPLIITFIYPGDLVQKAKEGNLGLEICAEAIGIWAILKLGRVVTDFLYGLYLIDQANKIEPAQEPIA